MGHLIVQGQGNKQRKVDILIFFLKSYWGWGGSTGAAEPDSLSGSTVDRELRQGVVLRHSEVMLHKHLE